MIYVNVIDPATGYVIVQATAYTLESAEDYAASKRAEGYTAKVYVRDRDKERTVYPS